MGRSRVLVADDHKVVAEGIASAMSKFFTVVGQVHELESLLPQIKTTKPDVVVLDLTFDRESSLPIMREAIADSEITARFVVLTAHESRALEKAALGDGAHVFLLKGIGTDQLRFAIEAAAENRPYVPEGVWPDRGRADRAMLNVEGVVLRSNQVRVLLLLQEGLSRIQVADRLQIGIRGVDFHLRIAKRAIGIHKLQLLLNWVAEHRKALEKALEQEGEEG